MIRFLTILILFPFLSQAQPIQPGMLGAELITYLQNNYTPSSTLGYGPARDILYSEIDNVGNDLFGIYTNFKVTLDPNEDPSVSAYQGGAGLNAEHVYPQSKGASNEPQKSDLHNIFPSKVNVNEARGSCEYEDIVDSDTENWYFEAMNLSSIPTSDIDNYSEKDAEDCNFEPRESVKGDIARAVFYFYTIYQSTADVADPNFFHNQKERLLQWHIDDPVDTKEETRDDLIANKQGNHNPFILDVTLAERAYFPSSSTTQIENENWVKLQSNFVQDEIKISAKKDFGNMLLFNVDGRLMAEQDLEKETLFDISNQPTGVFYLFIQQEKKSKVFRIFKH